MAQPVNSNKGVSLIEVTVALAILLLVLLGIVQTLMISSQVNIKNRLRDEAVKIAREELECTRNLTFDAVNSSICIENTSNVVTKRFRNYTQSYCLCKASTPQGNVKRVVLYVFWNHKKAFPANSCDNTSCDDKKSIFEYSYRTETIIK